MELHSIRVSVPLTEASIRQVALAIIGDQADFIYLMGSAGTLRFQAVSDIDLAVHWKRVPALDSLIRLKNELGDILDRDVDLVSLNNVDLIFGRQVLETGRLLACDSPAALLNWKTSQLSAYPDFKYSRSIIEKAILRRKRYV